MPAPTITGGETVLRRGRVLTSRDTGVLAAIGVDSGTSAAARGGHPVHRATRSSRPGQPMQPRGSTTRTRRCAPTPCASWAASPAAWASSRTTWTPARGAARGPRGRRRGAALGGTSKGAGDVSSPRRRRADRTRIVAPGVALKPGKPICLAVTADGLSWCCPVPHSAIFTFHESLAPVNRAMSAAAWGGRAGAGTPGRPREQRDRLTEYLLVGLVYAGTWDRANPARGYPMGRAPGSVTTFSRADGFTTIGRHEEIGRRERPSPCSYSGRALSCRIGRHRGHCIGLDYLLASCNDAACARSFSRWAAWRGWRRHARRVRRGRHPPAGPRQRRVQPALRSAALGTHPGYGRLQGLVFRQGRSIRGRVPPEAVARAIADPACVW